MQDMFKKSQYMQDSMYFSSIDMVLFKVTKCVSYVPYTHTKSLWDNNLCEHILFVKILYFVNKMMEEYI